MANRTIARTSGADAAREHLEDYIAHAESMLSWTRTPCLHGAVRRQWERWLARLEERLAELGEEEAQG